MPIEIRELVIKASVGAGAAPPAVTALTPRQLELLVQQCVERVLESLADARQR